jgi:signal transduction histidine kinase
MTPPLPSELYLICFATASVIHGAQTVLSAKLLQHRTGYDRVGAKDGIALGVTTFFWQFGNFLMAFVWSLGLVETSVPFRIGSFVREAALVCFPLLFSYLSLHLPPGSPSASSWQRVGAYLRYFLWPWTVLSIGVVAASESGITVPVLRPEVAILTTLHFMLLYFVIFTVRTASYRKPAEASGVPSLRRAQKAGVVAGVLAVVTFVLMLSGYWNVRIPFFSYIELAAMLSSVPFAIAVAYRQYQFPFMDTFIREVISGVILLVAFVAVLSVSKFILWLTACGVILAYCKAPLTRWVERTFIGYQESVEEQEERIGTAIRALTRLDEFGARVSEILASEFEAAWVAINSNPRQDAAHRFEIPGSGLWLSVGPRLAGRRYMSRQLRIARTAALQLAAHHHQLSQHEMREATARAQMQALQAQINPHFLFNTLNVLANLIHSNPSKAERVTEELADVFRYALESTRLEYVKLDDELEFIRSYLEIEKARFEERLVYSFDVDSASRSVRIPAMILQPLVENAVKHGIGPKVEGGAVRVSARLESDRLVIIVEDTGIGRASGLRQRGMGVGLNNIRQRLQHLYGENGTLSLQDLNPAGTRAVLSLPQLVGVQS